MPEDGVSEVFLEPWPEGITPSTIITLANGKRMYVVSVDSTVEEVFVANMQQTPRNIEGFIDIEVPDLTFLQKIKAFFVST